MIRRIQQLGQGQRILIFVLMIIGGLLFLAAITLFLISLSLNPGERQQAIALVDTVTVEEFTTLPDEDSYPASIAVAPDGAVYTGSYETGAIWRIQADKPINETVARENRIEADTPYLEEIAGTRETIGSVRALDISADGTLYVLDGTDSDPRARGGTIWSITPDGTLTDLGGIERTSENEDGETITESFLSPYGLTLDNNGNLYVSDRGFREVWRITPDGDESVFWTPPAEANVAGLFYDENTDSLLMSNPDTHSIFRVSMDGTNTEVVYQHDGAQNPGFTDVTVLDGTIYAVAIDQRAIVRVSEGEIFYIVGTLRGPNALASSGDDTLYVTNFDSASLVNPGQVPQLPFGIDRVMLAGE